MLDVDPHGLDVMDRKLLEAVIHRFDGGPVGLDNVAAAIGEERDTIEDVIEPYLIQQGYLQRTPRGRVATLAAYRHLGVAPPKRTAACSPTLFDSGRSDQVFVQQPVVVHGRRASKRLRAPRSTSAVCCLVGCVDDAASRQPSLGERQVAAHQRDLVAEAGGARWRVRIMLVAGRGSSSSAV